MLDEIDAELRKLYDLRMECHGDPQRLTLLDSIERAIGAIEQLMRAAGKIT